MSHASSCSTHLWAPRALLALVLLWSVPIHAQTQRPLPPLPVLPLDSYEPAIRGPIEAAYQDARDHQGDPAREGILGMVLYAHEQYEFAAPCFQRAHAMDPGEGRWAYYLGRAQALPRRPRVRRHRPPRDAASAVRAISRPR